MELKINDVKNEKIELGDIVVINCNETIYKTLASQVSGRDYQFCLINLEGDGVWSSAKTIEELNEEIKSGVMCFDVYEYTIYKASEYALQLTKK